MNSDEALRKNGEFDVEHRPLDFEHEAERRRAEDDNWVASMGLERVRDLSFRTVLCRSWT